MIVIGAVFARGNSKGVKNKNLLKFKNRTLVGQAIRQAYSSKFIKKVYISSDNQKIINNASFANIAYNPSNPLYNSKPSKIFPSVKII